MIFGKGPEVYEWPVAPHFTMVPASHGTVVNRELPDRDVVNTPRLIVSESRPDYYQGGDGHAERNHDSKEQPANPVNEHLIPLGFDG